MLECGYRKTHSEITKIAQDYRIVDFAANRIWHQMQLVTIAKDASQPLQPTKHAVLVPPFSC